MHQRAFLGAGWARGGASEVVRRAHPASGAQWNVQVVRGKVNGKCLWNACKALSLGLLLMVLGAAMATIGYYADHLSIAQEVRVMGVGGFIVVAACVMTFEARDSAAKVVPARLKMSTNGPPSGGSYGGGYTSHTHGGYSAHGSLRTSGSQTGSVHQSSSLTHGRTTTDRRALTESFLNFSRGLSLKTQCRNSLKVPQGSINKSPSAPNLVLEHRVDSQERSSPVLNRYGTDKSTSKSSRRTFANCALLNPSLLHRHALSVDETAAASYRLSHESLQGSGSQGSLALDLHLECPVTLRIHDRRRNPLMRQKRVDEDERHAYDDSSRRSSHSCSPRIPVHFKDFKSGSGGSTHQLPLHVPYTISRRRSSNASDSTHRSRTKRRDYPHHRGKLERAISSDSRLMGAMSKTHRHYSPTHGSIEQEPGGSSSDTDIRKVHGVVHFYKHN
ncbi:uncharacterized protein LOC135143266 isoform X2 [Zophobas morio]|uniref:uncharacterized protein LOC135143266 isoform X2 n=1 Tax=Zophobas morio TaxID=2755281 RepID=UPI0030838F25